MTFLTRTSNCTLASSLHLRHLLHRPELGAKCLTGRWVRRGRFSQGRQSVWQWLRKQVGFYGSKIRQWSHPLLITRHLVSKEVALLCYPCVPLGFWSPVCVCVCVCVCVSWVSQLCPTLPAHGLWPTRLLCPWTFSGKNTEVGCHFLLQGIFPTQGSDSHLLHLLHWQVDFFYPWTTREALDVLFLFFPKISPFLHPSTYHIILFKWFPPLACSLVWISGGSTLKPSARHLL